MKIRRTSVLVLAAAALAWAQTPPPADHGRVGGPRFLGAEAGMPRRVIKGAPFSGDLVTEITRILADGNHIRRTSTVHLVRDSEGRTRRDESLAGLGALASGGGGQQVTFIYDPVAGISYALDPAHKTASRSTWTARQPGARSSSANPASREMRAGGRQSATEALGASVMEGLPVEGTRTTITIPAGAVGNEAPIQLVIERWYSADLGMAVLTKRTDPRSGETITRLTNVSRAEPSLALFQVPADFKVTDQPAPRFQRPADEAAQ